MTDDQRACSGGAERTWSSIWCLIFGHNWVGHTAYKLRSDIGRSMYGDLCETCGKFQPRSDGRERFENPPVKEDLFNRSLHTGTDRDGGESR